MKRKYKMNSKILLKIISVIFLILVVFSCYKLLLNIYNTKGNKACISNARQTDINCCDAIKNVREREYCNFLKGSCDNINDLNVKYVCNRLEHRVHMWSFLNNPSEVDSQDLPNFVECSGNKNNNEKFKCIINLAKQKSNLNNSNFEQVCSKIKNSNLKGECEFYLILDYIPKLILSPSEYYDSFFDYCSSITHLSWRSECFYVMADELTLNSIGNELFELITKACIQSDDSYYYSCFNHNAILMKERAKDFCNYVPEDRKGNCFSGYGFYQGKKLLNESLMTLIDFCEDTKYESKCMYGVTASMSAISVPSRINFTLNICNKMPSDFQNNCFHEFGKLLINLKIEENNTNNQTQHCNLVPINFREMCHYGFAKGLDILTKANIKESLEFCEGSSLEFISFCYQGIIDQLERYLGKDSIDIEILCTFFPKEYFEYCINRVQN